MLMKINCKINQKQHSRGVLKIGSKFTTEHSCGSVISIKLQSNFIETTLWPPVNLLHIYRTPFPKNTSGGAASEIQLITSCNLDIFVVASRVVSNTPVNI